MANEEGKKLYVGNLPYKVTDNSGVKKPITNDNLREVFEAEGIKVLDAIAIQDRETKQPKGFGFIRVSESDYEKALSLDGLEVEGRNIKVNEAREKERSAR